MTVTVVPSAPIKALGGLSFEQLILILYPTFLIPATIFWFLGLRNKRRDAVQPRWCRNIALQGRSNIDDEYDDDKYAAGVKADPEASGEPRWKIKALFIHPIKSCAPIELSSSTVDGSGLAWDRKFAFAELITPQKPLDAPEEEKKPIWEFRTLRRPGWEKMALIKPEVWVPDGNMQASKQSILVIKYPHVPTGIFAALDRMFIKWGFWPAESSFQVPLDPPPDHNYPSEDVIIWKNTPKWLNYGRHVPEDFKHWLGATKPLSLFRVDPASYREVHRNAPRKADLGYQPIVGFADAYPVHLLSLASVRDIAVKVRSDIPKFTARRFRSNILITGPAAYDEDDWQRVRIGGETYHCACHTVRCRLPNVDPDTSERHPVEPDKMLKSFRCIDDGDPKNACLGLMLVPAKESGIRVEVGQGIEVLERGEHHYIKS